MLNIALFGPPGAGKGTQSELLMKKYKLIYIATGEILRDEIKKDTDIGREIKEKMEKGHLVHDGIIVKIIEKLFSKYKNSDGFLFDGFPRTYVQAYIFDGLLQRMHTSLTGLISLEVPKSNLRKRLASRSISSNRKDDSSEVIENRLREYDKKTLPVINYYEEKGIHYPVDGVGNIKTVFEKVSYAVEHSLSRSLTNVVVFGYPGAGKGTQAKLLEDEFGLVYISIGKILRDETLKGSEIGKLAKPYMDEGVNVPDEIVIKVIEDKIKVNPEAKGFVFKGFPRTIIQTYIIEGIMINLKSHISCYLELKVSPLDSIKRLSARGKTNSKRKYDENIDSIIHRLEDFEKSSIPVMDYYKNKNKVIIIDGRGKSSNVFKKVKSAVEISFKKVR